jgi:hypothetical protein
VFTAAGNGRALQQAGNDLFSRNSSMQLCGNRYINPQHKLYLIYPQGFDNILNQDLTLTY